MNEFYLNNGIPICLGVACILLIASNLSLKVDGLSLDSDGLRKRYRLSDVLGVAILGALTLVIGLRPILPMFTDMLAYASEFYAASMGVITFDVKDIGFNILGRVLVPLGSVKVFFLSCTALSILFGGIASRSRYRADWLSGCAAYFSSFSFYAGSVNVLRSGIAASIALWALSVRGRRSILLIGLATLFHLSFLILPAAMLATRILGSQRLWLIIWGASLVATTAFGLDATRLAGLIDWGARNSYFSKDLYVSSVSVPKLFIIYSSGAVIAIIFWSVVRKTNVKSYTDLANIYLCANSVWLLLGSVTFSDRFAFPSWVLIPWLLMGPTDNVRMTIPLRAFGVAALNSFVLWYII